MTTPINFITAPEIASKYMRDYFKSKFALDVVNDMIYAMKDNDKVTERLQEIANMNK